MRCTEFELKFVCPQCGHYYETSRSNVLDITTGLSSIIPERIFCQGCQRQTAELASLQAKVISTEITDTSDMLKREFTWICPRCRHEYRAVREFKRSERMSFMREMRDHMNCKKCKVKLSLTGFNPA